MVEFRIYLKVIKVKFSPCMKQQQHINNFYHAHKRNLFSKGRKKSSEIYLQLILLTHAKYTFPPPLLSSLNFTLLRLLNISAPHMHLGVMLESLHIHSSVSNF